MPIAGYRRPWDYGTDPFMLTYPQVPQIPNQVGNGQPPPGYDFSQSFPDPRTSGPIVGQGTPGFQMPQNPFATGIAPPQGGGDTMPGPQASGTMQGGGAPGTRPRAAQGQPYVPPKPRGVTWADWFRYIRNFAVLPPEALGMAQTARTSPMGPPLASGAILGGGAPGRPSYGMASPGGTDAAPAPPMADASALGNEPAPTTGVPAFQAALTAPQPNLNGQQMNVGLIPGYGFGQNMPAGSPAAAAPAPVAADVPTPTSLKSAPQLAQDVGMAADTTPAGNSASTPAHEQNPAPANGTNYGASAPQRGINDAGQYGAESGLANMPMESKISMAGYGIAQGILQAQQAFGRKLSPFEAIGFGIGGIGQRSRENAMQQWQQQMVERKMALEEAKAGGSGGLEAPKTTGGMQWDPQTGQWSPIPGYLENELKLRQAGATNVNVGGGTTIINPQPLTAGEKGDLQGKVISNADIIDRLRTVNNQFEDSFQTIGRRLSDQWSALREKGGATLDQQSQDDLAKFTSFKQNTINSVTSMTRSMVQSGRMSQYIAQRIIAGLPDVGTGLFDGDSPTEFRTKLQNTTRDIKYANMRYNYLLAKNLPLDTQGIDLADVPGKIQEEGDTFQKQYTAANPNASPDAIKAEVKKHLAQVFGY